MGGGAGGGGFTAKGATQEQADQATGNVQNSYETQQKFLQALSQQNGVQNQQDVFLQQKALADQLQQQAMGQGPNPAQAQLAQNTGANIQQQAALMAGQRGANANSGLMARQAAMQGGNMQQQAVGQAATMQANQQLAAQQALMQQQQAMGGLATNQVGQQQTAITQGGQLALGGQKNTLDSLNNQNTTTQAALAAANQSKDSGIGGMLGGLGSLAMTAGKAYLTGGTSLLAEGGGGGGAGGIAEVASNFMSKGGAVPGKAKTAGDSKKNDTVHAVLSPGEIVIPRSIVAQGPDAIKAFAEHIMEQEGE